jgi:hypothetical protein
LISLYSNLACGWANEQARIEIERVDLPVEECRGYRSRQCLMLTYAISTYELQSLSAESASDLVALLVRYRYLMVFLDADSNDTSALERCMHVATCKHLKLTELIGENANHILTKAIKYAFSQAPSFLKWSRVLSSSCYEAVALPGSELPGHYCIDIISVLAF